MINNNITVIFLQFTIFFVIVIILLELYFYITLRKKQIQPQSKKFNIFGLLMELDNLSIMAISIIFIRYLFIIFGTFSNNYFIDYLLIILLILSVLFGITSKSLKNLIIEIFNSIIVYAGILCFHLLSDYLIEVRVVWYIVLGKYCLMLFLFIYITYFLLRNISFIVSRGKLVRRKRNEDI